MSRFAATILVLTVVSICSASAFAQRGTGEPYGIVRSGENPDVIALSGELVDVFSGECENTTGYAVIGTHVHVRDANGELLNIHLGPEQSVATITPQLKVGEPISFEVYRTDRLAANSYVAVSLKQGDTSLLLRDNTLQPFWARSVSGGRGVWGRGNQVWGRGNRVWGRGARTYGYGRSGNWGAGRGAGRGYYRRGGRGRW